jgi:hypothetical protein
MLNFLKINTLKVYKLQATFFELKKRFGLKMENHHHRKYSFLILGNLHDYKFL